MIIPWSIIYVKSMFKLHKYIDVDGIQDNKTSPVYIRGSSIF